MARKGIKVKELGKELGVTSRRIIEGCRQAGIRAQNSISKLSHEEAARIRAWFSAMRQDRK